MSIEKHTAHFLLPSGEPFVAEIEIRDRENPRITIDGKKIRKYKELSICGSTARSAGQCIDLLREVQSTDAQALCTIWGQWHLNGSASGTRQQMDALRKAKVTGGYDKAIAFLKRKRLYTNKGFKYGEQNFVEILPESVIDTLRTIAARNTRENISTDEAVNERWAALVNEHGDDAVNVVRKDQGNEVVDQTEDGEDIWSGGDIDEAERLFEEYRGRWDSVADFAEDFAESVGYIKKDDPLHYYVDWKAFGANLEQDLTVLESGGYSYIFWTR